MKSLLLSLLILSSTPMKFNGDSNYYCNVEDYEYEHGLYYKSVNGQITRLNKKGKEESVKGTRNIAIMDIETEKITYLFDEKFSEFVVGFYFEKRVDMSDKRVIFNVEQTYSDNFIKNNYNIRRDKTSDIILIKSFDPQSQMYSIWQATKRGNQIEKVSQFAGRSKVHYDVLNSTLRVVTNDFEKLDMKHIPIKR